MKYAIIVAWHSIEQLDKFCEAWRVDSKFPEGLIMQQDVNKEGCARTKNKGIKQALDMGADVIVVLDDDCYPTVSDWTLEQFAMAHVTALEPQPVTMFQTVTEPASRGTPYFNKSVTMPVAASMGFWTGVPDLDAASQLLLGTAPISFKPQTIFGRYFPLSGMNFAFSRDQYPWCKLIEVPRYDDIWMGFLWQKHAYETGQCFNLNGPLVSHSRQSNVWHNLRVEVQNMERNETLWQKIQAAPVGLEYDYLKLHVGL